MPVPSDVVDGTFQAYWRRPAAYLDPAVRSNISIFSLLEPVALQQALDQLDHISGAAPGKPVMVSCSTSTSSMSAIGSLLSNGPIAAGRSKRFRWFESSHRRWTSKNGRSGNELQVGRLRGPYEPCSLWNGFRAVSTKPKLGSIPGGGTRQTITQVRSNAGGPRRV